MNLNRKKVRIIQSRDYYWYKVGEEYVVDLVNDIRADVYMAEGKIGYGIGKEDCIFIEDVVEIQKQIEAAKTQIEKDTILITELEKLLVIENSRPFNESEYNQTIAKIRQCPGRIKFKSGSNNYCVRISTAKVDSDVYAETLSASAFGVWFASDKCTNDAIASVGEANLRKAMEFEMNIGVIS